MPSRRLIFFDDDLFATENALFLMRLRSRVDKFGLIVDQEKSIRQLEEQLQSGGVACLILDIMSVPPRGFSSIETGQAVPSSMAGIEILRRCRSGYYGDNNQAIPIFMRSARGEQHILRICKELGASGYYQAGTDDGRLIEAVLDKVVHEH